MSCLRGLVLLWLWVLAVPLTQAQVDTSAERARIAQERMAADQRLREQEQACNARFAVTACVEAARKAHRDAITPLRQQEILLDDANRQQRAAQRRAEQEEKAAQSKRDVGLSGTDPTAVDESASAPKKPRPSSRQTVSPEQQIQLDRQRAQKQAAAQFEADQRVKSQRQKLETAQRRKAEVEKRNADKAASGKPPPAALKVPPAASNS
ncbi:MAG: hypothetical protein HEQ39_14165 [Rhizobacter sp.]